MSVASKLSQLFQVKSIESIQKTCDESQMKRTLGPVDLALLGVGGVTGTGIFVLSGQAAASSSGPAVALSYVISGIAAMLAGLCYAEMSAMLPISGAAYAYAYVALGEFAAWMTGWDLVLEYLIGCACVAAGWSGYFVSFLKDVCGVAISSSWTNAPIAFKEGAFVLTGDVLNLPAFLVTMVMSVLLCFGMEGSSRYNHVILALKATFMFLFIGFGFAAVNVENWTPFIPPVTETGQYGIGGVLQGASMVFLSYAGFEAVTTAAQETRNPQRNLPIGLISTLIVLTILYSFMSLVMTGLAPYTELGVSQPVAVAVKAIGQPWLSVVITIGAVLGLTSVLMMCIMCLPRIFYNMSQDGMLPTKVFGQLHPKYKTPVYSTLLVGLVAGIASAFLPVGVLGELSSVGTLFAYLTVCIGVLVLRLKKPAANRPFKVPFGSFVIPLLGAGTTLTLITTATLNAIIQFVGWMLIGAVVYFAYPMRKSHIRAALNEKV